MHVGYVRVSTSEQDYRYQIDDLLKAGCPEDMVFKDKASGKRMSRPDFDRMLTYLRQGDTVVVWKIDRLGRNFTEMVATMADLFKRGINILSTSQGIDTNTPMGKAMAYIAGVFAEMELEYNRERTKKSLQERRKRGIKGGRPKHPFFSDPKKFATFKAAYDRNQDSLPDLLRSFGLEPKDRYSFYRYLRSSAVEVGNSGTSEEIFAPSPTNAVEAAHG
jgi:DNA invertase Pin-like site-specific DNA recombinase